MREKLFWQKGQSFRGNVLLDLVYIKLIYYKLLSKCKFEDTYTTNVIGCNHSINDNNVLRKRLLLFELYYTRGVGSLYKFRKFGVSRSSEMAFSG
jgi:hypothetical protein